MIYRRFHRDVPVDEGSPSNPRPPQTILEENRQLRTALTMLSVKFEQLSRLNEDRQLVGEDIRPLCTPATVTGADSSGVRESLTITTAGFGGLKNDMPVVYAHELVGRVARAGIGGSQVRLITDPGFPFTARIYRYRTDADGQIVQERVEGLQPLVQGVGHGQMSIRSNISMAQVKELRIAVDDMVLLDDRDWPANIQGFFAGHIKEIHPQQNAPLFAEIRVEPASDLMKLREVMVMVKN
jgi:cell shape-determining protein MreC